MFLIFSYYFNILISKIIFLKNKKNIILIYFKIKNTLKNNNNYNSKYFQSPILEEVCGVPTPSGLVF